MSGKEQDWELSEAYYSSREEKRKLSLEDFIKESDTKEDSIEPFDSVDEKLKRTVEEVHKVLALAREGKNISEIASLTGFDEKYIYNIQVCAQGFREDDEIAVAHLVLG